MSINTSRFTLLAPLATCIALGACTEANMRPLKSSAATPGVTTETQYINTTVAAQQPVLTQQLPTQNVTYVSASPAYASTQVASVSTPTYVSTSSPSVSYSSQSYGAPSASRLDMSVASSSDVRLSNNELRDMIAGRTVYSQNLDDSSKTQIGTFNQDGTMSVVTGGRTISGHWSVEGDQVCYFIDSKRFCSSIQRSAKSYNGEPIHYFRRDNGQATVVITGIS